MQGDVVGIINQSGAQIVSYAYDAWGNLLSAVGNTSVNANAEKIAKNNPLRYRGYVYDTETGLYYLQSRYYNPEIGRFINADALVSTGQGLLGNNMFTYCRNNPIARIDVYGTRDAGYWSLKNDDVGLEILFWYLFGGGEDFPSGEKHSDYLKKNENLKNQVKQYLFVLAASLSVGESIEIDISISVIIENGEDIIGYQYLHGTNADVGGFQIQGTITRLDSDVYLFDLTYTWNDIIDPNFSYKSDQVKAAFAKRIPFADPTDYKISISWYDMSIGSINGRPGPNYGWLYSAT